MADFDLGSLSGMGFDAPSLPSVPAPTSTTELFGPAFTGSLNQDVLQAGGTMNQAGIPQGGGNWLTQLLGANRGGAPMPGGSGGNWYSDLLNGSDLGSLLSTGLGLGVKGMQLATGIQSQKQGADQARVARGAERGLQGAANTEVGLATPLAQFGQQGMLGGPLAPGQEAQIKAWRERTLAQIRDQAARSGISESTMMQQMQSWVDEQEQIMRGQMAAQTYQAGTAGLQIGSGDLARLGLISSGAAGTAQQQEQQLYQNIFNVLGASGK